MRIADVLRERDDDDGISGERSLSSITRKCYHASTTAISSASSPSSRSLLSRWFRKRWKRSESASDGEPVIRRTAPGGILSETVDSGRRSLEISLPSGGKPNEMAFNVGMGIGMAFILAGNAAEMNKMKSLRKQMEILLKQIKSEVRRRDEISPSAASDGEDATSTPISMQHLSSSLDLEEPKHFVESDGKIRRTVDDSRGIDQLEAEVQMELERMQLNLEGKGDEHVSMELKSKKVDYESSRSSPPEWYDNMADEHSEKQDGVCAHDLERRLHELLQTRQQERIEALEAALDSAQRRLLEKEAELCCWKNNSGLAHQNEDTFFSLSFM